MVDQTPTADLSQPLVHIYSCTLGYLTFPCSLCDWISLYPPVDKEHELLQWYPCFFKEGTSTQWHRLLTTSNWAPPSNFNYWILFICDILHHSLYFYQYLSSMSDRRCKDIPDPQLGQVLLVARRCLRCRKAIRSSVLPKITGSMDSMLKAMAVFQFFPPKISKFSPKITHTVILQELILW